MSHESSTNAVNWTEEEKNEQLDELSREAFRMLLPIFILCVLLMTIGIPGNILVFLVYLLQFQPSTARFFIKAMAICDLFTNTIAIPAMIWKISHLYRPCHSISCESISVATTFPIMMSSSLLICVAIDRWRRVCLPLEWQLTTFHAKLMLFATIPVTCIFVVPLTYLRGDRTFNTNIAGLQGTICDFTTDHHKHVYGILLLVYVLTLMLLLGLAYGSICLRLYQQDREFQKRLSVTTNDPCVNKDRISEDSYLKNDSTVQQNSMTSDSFMMGHFRVMRHKHQDQSMYGNYANDSQQNPTIDMQCNPPLLEIVTESKSVAHTEPLDVEKSKQPLALEASITQQQNVMVGSFPSSQNLPSTTPCPTPPRIRISSSTDPSFSGSTANPAEAVMPSPSLLKEPIFRKESSCVDTRQPNVLEVASTKKPEAPTSSLSPITTPTECLSGQPNLSRSLPEGLDRVFTDEKDAGLDRPLVPAVSSTSQPANVSLCDNPTENIVAPQTTTLLDSKPQSVIPLKHGHSDVTPLPVTEKDDGDIKGPRKLSLQDVRYERKDDSHLGFPSQSKTSVDDSSSLTYSYIFSPDVSVLHTAHSTSRQRTNDRNKIVVQPKTRTNLLSVTTLTMLVVSTISVIFYIPFIVVTVLKISYVDVTLSALKLNMVSLAQTCVLFNSVINIFIYSVCNYKFRAELRVLLTKCLPQ